MQRLGNGDLDLLLVGFVGVDVHMVEAAFVMPCGLRDVLTHFLVEVAFTAGGERAVDLCVEDGVVGERFGRESSRSIPDGKGI